MNALEAIVLAVVLTISGASTVFTALAVARGADEERQRRAREKESENQNARSGGVDGGGGGAARGGALGHRRPARGDQRDL